MKLLALLLCLLQYAAMTAAADEPAAATTPAPTPAADPAAATTPAATPAATPAETTPAATPAAEAGTTPAATPAATPPPTTTAAGPKEESDEERGYSSSCEAGLRTTCRNVNASQCQQITCSNTEAYCNTPRILYIKKGSNAFIPGKITFDQTIPGNSKPLPVYTFFGKEKPFAKLDENDNTICASAPIDTEVCEIGPLTFVVDSHIKYDFVKRKVAAGEEVKPVCQEGYELANKEAATGALFCDADGEWKDEAGKSMGKIVACRKRMCKMCPQQPTMTTANAAGAFSLLDLPGETEPERGTCDVLRCKSSLRLFAVKVPGDSAHRYTDNVVCSGPNEWSAFGTKVESAVCVQKAYCSYGMLATTKRDCTEIADKKEVTCKPPPTNTDPQSDTNPIKCEDNLKLMIRNHSSEYFEEAKGINCDGNTGLWKAEFDKETRPDGQTVVYFDEKMTMLCASANPKQRPATTTTTTTTQAPKEICDLCMTDLLPPLIKCDKCSNTTTFKALDADTCSMDVERAQYTMIINSFVEVEDAVQCKRATAVWTTKDDTTINKYAAHKKQKKAEIKTMTYVVIGGGVCFVLVCAIVCIVIFIKCRRKIRNIDEFTKKERGVTKRYMGASNVVKTKIKVKASKEALESAEAGDKTGGESAVTGGKTGADGVETEGEGDAAKSKKAAGSGGAEEKEEKDPQTLKLM